MRTFPLLTEFIWVTLVKNYTGFRCTIPQHIISTLSCVRKGPSKMKMVEQITAMGLQAALMGRQCAPLGGMDTVRTAGCGHGRQDSICDTQAPKNSPISRVGLCPTPIDQEWGWGKR